MRYFSVCSGIEAATVAWHPLGWTPAGFSEIEAFPRRVLEQRLGAVPVDFDHRWEPGSNLTPLFGDFTQIEAHHVGPIDLLVGGTPCQAFSVAGKRLGMDDPRGNLTIEFFRLAERIRPRWLVWENVPGVLSNWSGDADGDEGCDGSEDSDFAAILSLFSECGYRGGWRVLDAQYVRVDGFGRAVPQRRRRVFLVGHSGNDARAVTVLFDPESLRGFDPPRRKARQGASAAPCNDPEGDRGAGPDSGLIAGTVSSKWSKGAGGPAGDECQNLLASPVASTLDADFASTRGLSKQHIDAGAPLFVAHSLRGEGFDASEDGTGRGTPLVAVEVSDTLGVGANQTTGKATEMIAAQLIQTNQGSGGNRSWIGLDEPHQTLTREGVPNAIIAPAPEAIPFDTTQITHPANFSNPSPGDPCHPLAAAGHPPTIAFTVKDHGGDASEDLSPTLRSMGHDGSHANGGGQVAVAYRASPNKGVYETGDRVDALTTGTDPNSHPVAVAFQPRIARNGRGQPEEVCPALNGADAGATSDMRPVAAIPSVDGWAVRRLTPRECERLQGFPDDWTLIEWRGKPAADGPRYKAVGNSMAVNVMRWIGTRIALVEEAVRAAGERDAA